MTEGLEINRCVEISFYLAARPVLVYHTIRTWSPDKSCWPWQWNNLYKISQLKFKLNNTVGSTWCYCSKLFILGLGSQLQYSFLLNLLQWRACETCENLFVSDVILCWPKALFFCILFPSEVFLSFKCYYFRKGIWNIIFLLELTIPLAVLIGYG